MLALSSLKEIREPIRAANKKEDSLLIVCANFEYRSTAIIRQLSVDYSVKHAVIWVSREYLRRGNTQQNFAYIQTALRVASGSEPTTIEFGADHPIPPMVLFQDQCSKWMKNDPFESITLDVTAFPREQLLMLLRVLDSFREAASVRLYYAEPEKYGTETKGGWLTRGVRSVRTVPGFGGIQQPRKRKLLLLFLGHEDERVAIIWKRHQPEKTIAIVPDPSYRKDLNGIVERTHRRLFVELGNTSLSSPVPARGIDETQEAIVKFWEQYHDSYFIVVAPFGTKLQTLGMYKAVRLNPEIQITYAVPSVINFKAYSYGVGSTWEIPWARA